MYDTDEKKNIVKPNKLVPDFLADNIDTTRTLVQVLKDLDQRNHTAVEFYLRLLMQRKQNCNQRTCEHPLSAFAEDWDGALNSGYFESFPFKCFTPKMIAPMRNIKRADPIASFLEEKRDWVRDSKFLDSYRTASIKKKALSKYERPNEDVILCPKVMVEMAANLDSDPDPYFDMNCSYNWYYAGNGNLQLVCVDWVDYLLHSEFSTLYLTQFSKNDLSLSPEPAATFDCEGTNILETIWSTQNIVALRTKNKVFILKISAGKKLSIEKVKAMDSELAFTSISFDSHHKNILYVTSVDKKLTIVNLDRLTGRTVKLKAKPASFGDNWQTIVGTERPYYTHVTKSCITVYDKRTNIPSQTWKNGLNKISSIKDYNEITAVKQCEGSSYMYLGTDHHIFLIDLRHEHSIIKPIQRWTHGMLSIPTYMSICNFEFNKDIICLSSQWCEDTRVLSNYNLNLVKDFQGVSMPFRPPSILNALYEARNKSRCFDLYNPIDERLCTAVSGNLIFEQGENYVILTQNSLGDITSHTLFPEHMESFLEDDGATRLDEWCKDYRLDKKPLVVSEMLDFSHVWRNLKRVPAEHRVGEGKHLFKAKSKFDEKEITQTFEEGDLDAGLLDIWMNDADQTQTDKSPDISCIFDETET